MDIVEYIASHWTEWLFAIITAAATFGYRSVTKKLQEEKAWSTAIADGVQSLLRECIVDKYNKYKDRGYCPIYAKESLKRVYTAYHNLGGNDVATHLYENLLELPEEKEFNEQQSI